jgi:hypothetical protein
MQNEEVITVNVEIPASETTAPVEEISPAAPVLSLEYLADLIRANAEAVAELRSLRGEVTSLHERISADASRFAEMTILSSELQRIDLIVAEMAILSSELQRIDLIVSALVATEEEEEEEEETVLPGEAANVEIAAAAESLIIPPAEIPAESKKKRGFIHI